MNITCVTSRYLPNLRYIARLFEADYAVVLDLAPLPHQNRNSFISRNRIMDKAGKIFWLSLPIHRKGIKFVKDAKIDQTNNNWIEKHIKSIAISYPQHKKVAGDFLDRLRLSLEYNNNTLVNINHITLSTILETMNYRNDNILLQSSLIDSHDHESHRLDISNVLNASTYTAGHVEWDIMRETGITRKMKEFGVNVIRSQELDRINFSTQATVELSCVHSICTIGPERTHNLIEQMLKVLKN